MRPRLRGLLVGLAIGGLIAGGLWLAFGRIGENSDTIKRLDRQDAKLTEQGNQLAAALKREAALRRQIESCRAKGKITRECRRQIEAIVRRLTPRQITRIFRSAGVVIRGPTGPPGPPGPRGHRGPQGHRGTQGIGRIGPPGRPPTPEEIRRAVCGTAGFAPICTVSRAL